MATTLHSFIDIFDTTFGEGPEAVQLKKIIIPIIQRDYAQGRKGPDVTRVRGRFLESLYKASSALLHYFCFTGMQQKKITYRKRITSF